MERRNKEEIKRSNEEKEIEIESSKQNAIPLTNAEFEAKCEEKSPTDAAAEAATAAAASAAEFGEADIECKCSRPGD